MIHIFIFGFLYIVSDEVNCNYIFCEFTKVKEWVTAFINLNEKSGVNLYSPWDIILASTDVPKSQCDAIRAEEGYYTSQYFILLYLKRSINQALQDSDFYNNVQPPLFKLKNPIENDSHLYNVCIELTTVFICYSISILKYFERVETNQRDMLKIDEYRRTHFGMYCLFNIFINSLNTDESNLTKIKADINKTFNYCVSGGFMDNIAKEYAVLTAGATLTITPEIFEKYTEGFINPIGSKICFELDQSTKLLGDYKLPISILTSTILNL